MKAKAQKGTKMLGNVSVKVQDLMKKYPPVFENSIKKEYYEKAAFCHRKQNGIVKISRWTFVTERKSPLCLEKHELEIQNVSCFFSYEEGKKDEKIWWLNFADENLFDYYGSDLFAQDEIQTFEHPLLGSVMEYLDTEKIPEMPSKTEEKDRTTPYLIENIPYWIRVNVTPILQNGEQGNFYGWRFSKSSKEVISRGVSIIERDWKNNIIAMAAPSGGKGEYSQNELIRLMETVLVAFGAAVKTGNLEKYKKTIIHTGNWGCGAFGNNKELMYLSQIIAASLVGVDTLIFHSADSDILEQAKIKFQNIQEEKLILFLENQHYHWQNPDGN